MSQESASSTEQKKFSLVHEPFSNGQTHFHPPKKNPNGHMASAKLLPQDKIDCVVAEESELATEVNRFFTPWKITAVSIIIITNSIAATAISLQKDRLTVATDTVEETYIAGKTDLARREFIELNLNNLKNITPVTETQNTVREDRETLPNNTPLAIPPTNLPQNLKLPQVRENTQYYYILSEYRGDRSLELAKTKVPHVSLIDFPQGVFIYMGAFAQKEPAREFVKQLKKIGLEGYVYPVE